MLLVYLEFTTWEQNMAPLSLTSPKTDPEIEGEVIKAAGCKTLAAAGDEWNTSQWFKLRD